MEGRYALIVANGGYRDPKLSRLRSPATDASELARVLSDAEIGAFEVELSADEPEHVLRRRVGRFFADRKRDDLLLLHFSCHGLKDDSGQLYFAASDTEVENLEATAISAEFVSRQMTRSRSRKVVALLDCCYSGAIARGLQFRAGAEVDVEDHLGGHGRVVITASSAMEYAFEGDELSGEGKPSVFTTAVVRGLESGEADRDQDRLISVDDLYDYVCEQVREVTPNQRPNMLSHLEGALYIARSSYVAPVTPAPLPTALVAAIGNPLAGVRAGAVGELRGLLEHGDPGTVAAARAALTTLAGDDSRRVGAAAAEALGSAAPTTGPHLAVAPKQVEPRDEPVAEPQGKGPTRNPGGATRSRGSARGGAGGREHRRAAGRADRRAGGEARPQACRRSQASGGRRPARPRDRTRRARPARTGRARGGHPGGDLVAGDLHRLGRRRGDPARAGCDRCGDRTPRAGGATRRPLLSAAIILAGGFALGAATAVSGLEADNGEGGTEGPVILAATVVLLGGVLGAGRDTPIPAPRWAALVAIPAACLSLLGGLLPWLYDETMHSQLDAPLEGGVWAAIVVACLSAVVYAVPGMRGPFSPALPLLAAGSFLLGGFVLGSNWAADNDAPMEIGFFLVGAGAIATVVVAVALAARTGNPP